MTEENNIETTETENIEQVDTQEPTVKVAEMKRRIEAEKTNAILMHVNKTYNATEIAKELGYKSAIEFNKVLVDKRIQFKQNDTWVLYSDYSNK